jgi:SSS family transporter
MTWLDWLIVAAYLVYIVYDGIRLTRKTEGVEGYFLANRSLPWWAVGLSVMATQLSAITLVGTTGQAFADGMRFIQFYFGLPLAMIILCMTVVPFFYRAKVYTAYEYLERRFDARTRGMTSFFFLLSRGLSCGVIVAAPSVILSIVLGWSPFWTIAAMGISTTIYTMFGGVQAVTWTDVKQMVVIVAGLIVVLVVIIASLPSGISFGDALSIAGAAKRLRTVDFSFNPKETYTIWSGLIGGLFLMLSYFGCDQSQVQRFLTAKSVSEGRTSLLMSAFVKIPMQFVILLIGVLVFVFYQFSQPPLIFNKAESSKVERSADSTRLQALTIEYDSAYRLRRDAAIALAAAHHENRNTDAARQVYAAADSSANVIRGQGVELVKKANHLSSFTDVNYVFPTFVMKYMPPGVVGLIIAAIFAAAMSSISAELNALATATVIDFYRRHFRTDAADAHYLLVSKIATGFWGVFACGVAYYATELGSLIEVVNKFGSFFYGSLLGVFVLAIGTRRATGRGAFWGLLSGIVTIAAIDNFPAIAGWWQSLTGSSTLLAMQDSLKMSFLWYNLIGCAVVVIVGMLLSLTQRSLDRTGNQQELI